MSDNNVVQRLSFPVVYKDETIGYWNLEKDQERYSEIEENFLELIPHLRMEIFTSKAGDEFLVLKHRRKVKAWYQEMSKHSYQQVMGFLKRGTAKVESFELDNEEQETEELLAKLDL